MAALTHYEQALEAIEAVSDQANLATMLRSATWVYLHLGHDGPAFVYTQRAIAICQTIDDRLGLAMIQGKQAQFESAGTSYQQARLLRQELGDLNSKRLTRHQLVELYLDWGRPEAACNRMSAVIELDQKLKHTALQEDIKAFIELEDGLAQ